MSENTKIEWADHSWSPWRGCTKVSPGCANCYAEGLADRFNRKDSATPTWGGWGKGKPRVLAKNWNEPVKWNKSMVCRKCGFTEPLESKKPHGSKDGSGWCGQVDGEKTVTQSFRRPTVFPSLCDWLDDEVPLDFIARFVALMIDTPNLTWLLLTKRPEKFGKRIGDLIVCLARTGNPELATVLDRWNYAGVSPRNIWIGTSVEDQQRADERIPALLQIPAAGRFLSVEPMLGPVDVFSEVTGELLLTSGNEYAPGRIDWVIGGGESGPGSRPCNVDWVRSIVKQCASAGVPCFVKQFGACPVGRWTESPLKSGLGEGWPAGLKITHPKGGDPAEWPEDLRVRQFPEGLR